ncbi:MAG: hypothetical protein CMJ58_00205 [Planctomycetaceae bacterium]|nr:hypothetical protein [Planctomycetaceae bacterium]
MVRALSSGSNSAFSLLLTLLFVTSASANAFRDGPLFNDPSDDTFGTPNIAHDIANVDAAATGTDIVVSVDFYDEIAPPSAFSARSVVGFLDIDLDQNAGTGAVAKKSEFSPVADDALGSEFYIDLFSERFHPGQVEVIDTATIQPVGMAIVTYNASSMTIALPLDLIGGDLSFNYGLIVGDLLDMSDEAPNAGFHMLVPEPSSIALACAAGLALRTRRRRNR